MLEAKKDIPVIDSCLVINRLVISSVPEIQGSFRKRDMDRSLPYRKVLIIENEPDIRNVLLVLLAGMGYEGEAVPGIHNALARIKEESFDALLLDLRCFEAPPEQVVSQIREVRQSLVGRVLVITGEVTSPEVLVSIERACVPQVRRKHLARDLLAVLKSLF